MKELMKVLVLALKGIDIGANTLWFTVVHWRDIQWLIDELVLRVKRNRALPFEMSLTLAVTELEKDVRLKYLVQRMRYALGPELSQLPEVQVFVAQTLKERVEARLAA